MAGHARGAVVVTGASTGIGRATALLLDKKGYAVFAGVRKQQDAKSLSEAGSERLTPITIDVTKQRSISAARNKVREAVGEEGLVGLVNNAGVGNGGPVETLRIQELRDVLEVNLVGQVAVTQAFLPLVRAAKGTIVFIASIGGRIASPFMSPYNTSKFAVEALGESLRAELAPWKIDVVVVEPGSIDTPIWSKGAETIDEQTEKMSDDEKRLYGKQLERMEKVLMDTASRGIPPEGVAKVIQKAIASEKPKHRYLVGTDAKIAARLKGGLPDRAFAGLVGRRFKMPTDVPPK
jgi:NAD(P)-dependent dehydrogenase (short-subunit alcohol dehydrogenase family)